MFKKSFFFFLAVLHLDAIFSRKIFIGIPSEPKDPGDYYLTPCKSNNDPFLCSKCKADEIAMFSINQIDPSSDSPEVELLKGFINNFKDETSNILLSDGDDSTCMKVGLKTSTKKIYNFFKIPFLEEFALQTRFQILNSSEILNWEISYSLNKLDNRYELVSLKLFFMSL